MLEGRFLWSSVLSDENGVIASTGLSSGSGRSKLHNIELKALITIILHCFSRANTLVSFQSRPGILGREHFLESNIYSLCMIARMFTGTTSPVSMTEMASIKLFTVNVCWNGSMEKGEL